MTMEYDGLIGLGLLPSASVAATTSGPLADVMKKTLDQIVRGIENQHPAI